MTGFLCRVHDESGAETVQLAMCVPMLLVLVIGVIQLCVMAFFSLTLAGETDQTAWAVDVSLIKQCSGTNAASAHVKQELLERSVLLDSEKLQVANATFTASAPYSYRRTTRVMSNRTLRSEDGKNRYEINQLYREGSGGLVEFDVSYQLPTIINLPGLSNVAITRHVSRERVVSTRTEIR